MATSSVSFGDIAYIVGNPLTSNKYVNTTTPNENHFNDSQELSLSSSVAPSSTEFPPFLLYWVFFKEFQKIKNKRLLITKLKEYGFDFSRYFYFLKSPTASSNIATRIPVDGILLSPSGGNGNLDMYEDFILSIRNLTRETIQNMEPLELEAIFTPIELETLRIEFNMPNLRIERPNRDFNIDRQIPTPQ